MALNPLGLSRMEVKLQVRKIQDQLELLENQQSLLDANYKGIARRLNILEEVGSRREGDLEKVRKIFDHDTGTRTRIEILKVLAPVLTSEEEKKPLLTILSE